MVTRGSRHGAVGEDVSGFVNGLPAHVLRAFPLALPDAALVIEVARGAPYDQLDAGLICCGLHLAVGLEYFAAEIDVVFVCPGIWDPFESFVLGWGELSQHLLTCKRKE